MGTLTTMMMMMMTVVVVVTEKEILTGLASEQDPLAMNQQEEASWKEIERKGNTYHHGVIISHLIHIILISCRL